jgi:2,3,4,5-tetrahydropyridine-2,6-dicarboxylate N-succinyltransferase
VTDVEKQITQLWEAGDAWRDVMGVAPAHDLVRSVIGMLDRGEVRVAEIGEDVVVNEWAKLAILMWFRVQEMAVIEAGPFEYVDKLPLKHGYEAAGVRVVPGASARYGSFLARGVVMMPCYVNIGAYVDSGTMVDTWATVGSCAQIGKNVHLSGGVGIGGVLEPLQAGPVIIEDNCFVGARSEVVEGVIVREGAVLGMGVYIGLSTKIVDRATGKIYQGEVPPYSVVVSGTMPGKPLPNGEPGPGLYCAVIVKRVDERTRSKTSINELLRD